MDSTLQDKLKQLVQLKSESEMLTEQRKSRQEEILSEDPVYSNLKELEKEKWAEYEAMRLEVQALGKELDLNGLIETDNGSVNFSYSKVYSVADDKKFIDYCKANNLVEKMYKLTVKATDFKKFLAEKDSEWEEVPWTSIEDSVSITVSVKK